MQKHLLWRLSLIAMMTLLAVAMLTGCKKDKEEEVVPDTSLTLNPDTTPKAETGFIPEATLSDSPFSLDGRTLGTSMAEIQAGWDAMGKGYLPLLSPDAGTGSLASDPATAAAPGEPFQEYAFFEDGKLVAFQQLIDMDAATFDARVEELTGRYGEPVDPAPRFMQHSDLFLDARDQNPARMVIWADTATRTALLGTLSQDGQHSMWAVFHPEGYDAAQFNAIGVSGS